MNSGAGVHEICDSYVDHYAHLNPLAATEFGISGHDDRMPDLSPDGHRAREELARGALAAIEGADPADDSQRIAKAVFRERLGLDIEIHEAGLPAASLNMIASPVQDIRWAFDLMATETAEDWAVVAKRLNAVPKTLSGYRASLLTSADNGIASASRQVSRAIEQCRTWSGAEGQEPFFVSFAKAAHSVPGVSDALRAELDAGVHAATEAYADLAEFLRDKIAPKAAPKDAIGEELYRLWSRRFLGADLDLRAAYEWGWSEFARVETEMRELAGRIKPGATAAEAAAILDADVKYRVNGAAGFQKWMQQLSDRALAELRGSHFDIPDELMHLECRIAPPGGGIGAYYTSPTDDLGRPGQMWWSLPQDRNDFSTWREASTVYHEGVPGHHLQIGTAVMATGLNRFQRSLCFIDGHGEGWALYAERLMRDLGYLDDGYTLGMLNKSLFRAARVIVDIGMHLNLEIPPATGFNEGARWTPDLGVEFLSTRTLTNRSRAVDEIDRYLGWPGQAPAYKLGERLWLSVRDEVRTSSGAVFDLKEFHMRALRSGPAGLDTMRDLLLGQSLQ